MTVEASFIMVIVLLVVLFLLKWSFVLHDITAGSAYLHLAVEKERAAETVEGEEQRKDETKSAMGFLFHENAEMDIKIKGDSVTGTWRMGEIEKQITSKMYHPEDFIRATHAFFKETGGSENGGILSKRDPA